EPAGVAGGTERVTGPGRRGDRRRHDPARRHGRTERHDSRTWFTSVATRDSTLGGYEIEHHDPDTGHRSQTTATIPTESAADVPTGSSHREHVRNRPQPKTRSPTPLT
ncbi:MAG: hypothetical protein P8Z68_03665, partial [Kineosporiaceae bacterium]